MEKSSDAFRTISEVAEDLDLPQHVLRFWETRFPRIRPLKRAGGRRYYRPADIALLRTIRQLLYDEGYTIKGVQRLLKDQGARSLRAGETAEPLDLAGPEAGGLFDTTDEPDGVGSVDLPSALARETPDAPLLAPTTQIGAATTAGGSGRRAALLDLLGTIEDCTRILDSVRRPG